MRLLGIGFHPAPSSRRPIRIAHASPTAAGARLDGFEECTHVRRFESMLTRPGPWLGVFDFPFGLARELVAARAWPLRWDELVAHLARLGAGEVRDALRAFCAARPRRSRLLRRVTECAAGAPALMGRTGEPLALRFQAGTPPLARANLTIPGIRAGDPLRIALEGSPALLAATVTRGVWRSAVHRGRGDVRELERERLVDALERGYTALGVRIRMAGAERAAVVADDRGDRLAALLCVAQAAWAAPRADFGLPAAIDPIEGWIVPAHLPPAGGRPKMIR